MYQIEMSLVFIRILREDEDVVDVKKGPYQDRPLLCPFRLLPLLTCS